MTPIILQEVLKADLENYFDGKVHVYIDEPPENRERGKREDMPQFVIALGIGEETENSAVQKVYISAAFQDTDGRGSARLICKNAIHKLREHYLLNPLLPKGFALMNKIKWVMPDGESEPPFAYGGIELTVLIPKIEYVDEFL